MARNRMTWNKSASPPPAMPVEEAGYEHPAAQPDPGADDYKSGDTSSWAEDPHPGPYENSAHPATPDEGPFHPAAKTASQEELEAAAERKAASCIRIAQALLGPRAAGQDVERQAFGLMYMPDSHIHQTLSRLAGKAAEDDEEMDEDEGKKASVAPVVNKRLARIERAVVALTKKAGIKAADWMDEEDMLDAMMDDESMYGMEHEDEMDEEAMLAQMMSEEGMEHEDEMDEEEAMLAQMMSEEGMEHAGGGHYASEEAKADAMLREMLAAQKSAEDEDEDEDEDDDEDSEEDEDEGTDKEASLAAHGVTQSFDGIQLTAGSVDQPEITENDSVLASLFEDDVSKYAGDEFELTGGSDKEANLDDELMAALRPQQPKQASGATSIGNVRGSSNGRSKEAAEVAELTGLWNAPPDVSEHFSSGNY